MSNLTFKIACVLIAAGNSSRLGQSKQLVKYRGKTLLNTAINLSQVATDRLIIVLGSDAEEHRRSIQTEKSALTTVMVNEDWNQGMGTSIARGVSELSDDFSHVLIMLCDQWALNEQDLLTLHQNSTTHPNKIICCEYLDRQSNKQVLGAPAIFPKAFFKELIQLRETGARKILEAHSSDVISVDVANAGYDLDTAQDLLRLNRH
ncbi:nucleotidyltransferase family protein [Aliikangiella marina]|uniref:Nucleotidyltransferase family protein n=1 Tax=Aliikangiella marina TaxID=1712262 RepID=A0A545T6V6_9GAMM|nr:nucleotidyltransferase family protein [Aliikangiella marina]TQV72957.1 nucleotidyltransferase family protein [Aliikangiella marina]